MAYEVVMPYHLHMPSYFLETFTEYPDFKSVGVRDNARSFDWPVIIRAVNTVDAMTATIEPVDWPILMKITDRILKEVKNVNRVCYDMSPKPNATIEWE